MKHRVGLLIRGGVAVAKSDAAEIFSHRCLGANAALSCGGRLDLRDGSGF